MVLKRGVRRTGNAKSHDRRASRYRQPGVAHYKLVRVTQPG